jgi:hypothetical protein
MHHLNERKIMNTITEIQHLATKPNAELAHLFNSAAAKSAWDRANDIWNALYARVHRQQYPNDVWTVGDARESRLIWAVNAEIDRWR